MIDRSGNDNGKQQEVTSNDSNLSNKAKKKTVTNLQWGEKNVNENERERNILLFYFIAHLIVINNAS